MTILLRTTPHGKLEQVYGSVAFHGYARIYLDRDLQTVIEGKPAELANWLRQLADKVEPKTAAQVKQ